MTHHSPNPQAPRFAPRRRPNYVTHEQREAMEAHERARLAAIEESHEAQRRAVLGEIGATR